MVRRVALVVLIAVGSITPVAADGIMASDFGDFAFLLPSIGKNWEQEKKPGLILVRDESDTLSDLEVAVFAPNKPGTLAEIETRLATELARPNILFFGEKVKSFKVVKSADETIATSPFRVGTATLNGARAGFAIGQRGGKTIILVGVGNEGVEERAMTNFSAIVHKLARPYPGTSQPEPAADESEGMPKLGAFAAVKDITASSTFTDRSKKDSYGAWRVLEFEVTDPSEGFPTTAWCEGKPDQGIGEGITINLLAPTKIKNLQIAAGVWLTDKLFKANNQITSLAISFDGGAAKKVAAPAERDWVEIPVGKAVSSIKITIDAVKKGRMNDSCISGVQLVGDEFPLGVVRGLDATAVSALPAAYDAVAKAISAPNRAGLDKWVAFPFTYESSDWFFEGKQKPVKHANWKSIETACKKKKASCPSGPNTGGREDPALVSANGSGSVIVTFPSRREVADQWHFTWSKGAWKVTSMVAGNP